jgi:two-component system, OmpR family, catabolic regulation response regulator CreB
MPRILLVEDETAIAQTVLYALRGDGHDVRPLPPGTGGARGSPDSQAFDLAVLDVGLPDMDGYALCRGLRRDSALPVIFLTARGSESERVLGLELGADDYIAKPFSPLELVARVRAVCVAAPRSLDRRTASSTTGMAAWCATGAKACT